MKTLIITACITFMSLGIASMGGCQNCYYDDSARTSAEEFAAYMAAKEKQDANRQPQNPGSGQNRPPQYTYNKSGGIISFGCVVSFFSGGNWWAIGVATPADIAQIQAGNVLVTTADNRTGYVGSSTGGTRTTSPMRSK